MTRDSYRLHEYFDRLEKREEITEADFRALVDCRAERVGTISYSSHFKGNLMKWLILFLIPALISAGILWKGTEKKAPSALRRTLTREFFAENSDQKISPIGSPKGEEQLSVATGNDRNGNTTSSLLQNLPWGYRFAPGQKFWYERTYLHVDSSFGDSHLSTEKALIEVLSVDDEGNITLTIEIQDESFDWLDEPIPHAKGLTEMIGSIPKIRAKITPAGQFIDGKILKNYPETVMPSGWENRSGSQSGGSMTSEQAAVKFDVEQWLPVWPDREAFDNTLYYTATTLKADTSEVVFLDDPEPTLQPNQAPQAEQFGDVIARKIPSTVGKRKGEDEEKATLRDSLRRNPPISYTKNMYEYRLEQTALKSSTAPIRIDNYQQKQSAPAYISSREFTERWDLRGWYTFRRADGAIVHNACNGTFASDAAPKLTRVKVEVRLLREEPAKTFPMPFK